MIWAWVDDIFLVPGRDSDYGRVGIGQPEHALDGIYHAEVVIDPFGAASFDLRLGNLRVDYSLSALALEIPGSAACRFRVGGLQPRTRYKFSTGKRLETDVKGVLRFNARTGTLIHIRRDN